MEKLNSSKTTLKNILMIMVCVGLIQARSKHIEDEEQFMNGSQLFLPPSEF